MVGFYPPFFIGLTFLKKISFFCPNSFPVIVICAGTCCKYDPDSIKLMLTGLTGPPKGFIFITSKIKNTMEKMSANTNALNWFEIPATDIARAKKFYETLFGITMDTQEMMGMQMAFFPFDMGAANGRVSGALVQSEMHKPSLDGAIVYLNANPGIQTVIDRIEGAGGKVIMPRTQISEEIGYMAFFIDTEGNRMALHAGN
jgi:predicted enzyme related to lactoylglutathione lyase